MNVTFNIILGLVLIFLGVLLIMFYQNLVKENKQGGLSFKIQTGGIGCIIIGIGQIIKELA
jgi:hypothetical protein